MPPRWLLWIVVWAPAAAWGQEQPAADTLLLLDGGRVRGTISAIDERGRVAAFGVADPLDLQGLRGVERSAAPPKLAPAVEIMLAGGGVIRASRAALGDDAVAASWAYGEQLRVPTAVVRAIKFAGSTGDKAPPETKAAADSPQGRDVLASALARQAADKQVADKDQLLVVAEGKVQLLVGLVRTHGPGGIEFEWEGKTRTIPQNRVYALVLAQLGTPHDPLGECTIRLADGSSPSGRLVALAAGKLTLRLAEGADIALPWNDVAGFTVRSNRLVFLSDLTPAAARVRPIVTLARPWRADRGVAGGPLSLGGRSYEKGLGVQSHSELVFAQDPRFDAFAATIGLDASAAGRGDCEFVVLGDGKELFRQRMRGADPPREVRVSTRGVKSVTLVVEPGEDLDLADHADWCDARFVQSGAAEN